MVYSDDSEDDCFYSSNVEGIDATMGCPNAAADTPGDVTGTDDAPPRESISTAACHDLPEAYLDRCAVLLDAALLLPEQHAHHDRLYRFVEGHYRVVHYPLCSVSRVNLCRRTLIQEPLVNLTKNGGEEKLAHNAKMNLITALVAAANQRHGVCPHFVGLPTDCVPPTRAFHTRFKEAKRQTEALTTNIFDRSIQIAMDSASEVAAQKEVANFFSSMVRAATQWCSGDPQFRMLEPAIAFLTMRDRIEEVSGLLEYAQVSLGVSFPKYRVFCMEDMVGPSWSGVVAQHRGGERCLYHKNLLFNTHAYSLRCVESSVGAMDDILRLAAEELERLQSAAVAEKVMSSPIFEDE